MLSGLIHQFDHLSRALTFAVHRGNETEVQSIDSQLQDLLYRIFELRARNSGEISAQIGFFKRLAVRYCEDQDSVRKYTGMMVSLFDRYLETGAQFAPPPDPPPFVQVPHGYDPSLHELVLDSLQERVAVIGLDYRYIYCNVPNAAFHERQPTDFIGKHLLDIIDKERFETRARPRLDQCFAGARVFYTYEIADPRGRMFEVKCRMTPLAGPDGAIMGAVISILMQPLFARVD